MTLTGNGAYQGPLHGATIFRNQIIDFIREIVAKLFHISYL